MKTYKIFVSPLGQTEAVKQGWSWPGCLFTTIWVLVKKMWGYSCFLWGLVFLWTFLDVAVPEGSDFSKAVNFGFGFGLPFGVGAIGNTWREKNLLKRGYEYKETVQAQTPEAALALWTKEGKQ